MRHNMAIYTTSQARTSLYKIVDDVQLGEHVHIVGRRSKAVIMSEDEYDDIVDTLYLQSIPGMSQALQEADDQPLDKCHKKLDW